MRERKESFSEGTRDLVTAISSGGSSDTGWAFQLKGRRAGICLSFPGFPLHFPKPFTKLSFKWAHITRALSSNPLGLTHTQNPDLLHPKEVRAVDPLGRWWAQQQPVSWTAVTCQCPASLGGSPCCPQHTLSFVPVSESPGFAGRGVVGKSRAVKCIALNTVRNGDIIKTSGGYSR